MLHQLIAPPPGTSEREFLGKYLADLRASGDLTQRLTGIDERYGPLRRLFLMGCGRSGTWLLTAAFSTFSDVEIVAAENPIEIFGVLATDAKALLVKRDHVACYYLAKMPESIEIVMIVRHPFAVLTSHNPYTKRKYHIEPDRWLAEMRALKELVTTNRPRTIVVRYEDLVRDPDGMQAMLADKLALTIGHPMAEVDKLFQAPPEAISAMHGLRPIDDRSLEKYRQDPEKVEYLRSILPKLAKYLPWVAETYGYDVSL